LRACSLSNRFGYWISSVTLSSSNTCNCFVLTISPTLTCCNPVASAIISLVVVLPVPGVPVTKMLGKDRVMVIKIS
ncbi:hypothetical protein A0J61_11140, partial [Choanephora cucurbitarum]